MPVTLSLLAGTRSNGTQVFEDVIATQVGSTSYKLIASPGLVLGVAAGDIIEVGTDRNFTILSRGGNIAIQVFTNGMSHDIEATAEQLLAHLHARLDGRTAAQLVYTVSANKGFASIEEQLNLLQRTFPSIKWFYGNVYDPQDGVTPLNWWLSDVP